MRDSVRAENRGSALKRRDFIVMAGGAAIWPLQALAQQQQPIPAVAFFTARTPNDAGRAVADAFRRGLGEAGFVEARNVVIEYYWLEGQIDRIPDIARELAARPVSVIAAFSTGAARAAKAATTSVPVVFMTGDDPVRAGIVPSLNRPGGNVTGITFVASVLGGKRLEFLRDIVPGSGPIGVLVEPKSAEGEAQLREAQEAARAIGQQLTVLNASTDSEIEAAFNALVQSRIGALLVTGATFFSSRRDLIVALAARHAIPAVYQFRDFAQAGGLISYGANIEDAYFQTGRYVARVLKGEKPSDLPVTQPTKFDLVLNLKTAKALGLEFPPKLLALADDVIE